MKMIIYLSVTALLLLTGCSEKNGMIDSAYTINNDYKLHKGMNTGLQINQMSINGLSPITNVGEIYYSHPERGVQNAIKISPEGTSLENTSYLTQLIKYNEGNVTMVDLYEIKKVISLIELFGNKIVEKKLTLLKDEAKEISIKERLSATDLASLTKLEAENKNLESTIKLEEIANDKNPTQASNEGKEVSANISMTCINNAYSKNTNLDKNTLEYFENMYLDLHQCYLDTTKKNNIMVFKWNKNGENKNSLNGTDFFTIHANNKKETSGYVIASGIEIEQLIPSKDYIEKLDASFSTGYFKGVTGVVTYTLKVKQILPFSSQKNENLFKLLASFSDIQHFSTNIKDLLEIGVEISALSVNDLSSFSNISQGKVSYELHSYEKYNIINKDTKNERLKKNEDFTKSMITSKILSKSSLDFIDNIKYGKEKSNTSIDYKKSVNIEEDDTYPTIFSVITEGKELLSIFK